MARRALPAVLALAALVADLAGAHGFALAMLFAAIPAAFVLMLDCFADVLDARCGARRPLARLLRYSMLCSQRNASTRAAKRSGSGMKEASHSMRRER